MELLDKWIKYDSPKLSLEEVKQLIDKDMKEEIFEGTFYVLYNFLKTSELDSINSSIYDFEDVISSCMEIWLEFINEKKFLEIDYYSQLFNQTFFNRLAIKLGIDKYEFNDVTDLSFKDVNDILNWFIKNKSISYNEFLLHIEQNYPRKYCFFQHFTNLYEFISYIYEYCDNVELSKTKLKFLQNLLLENFMSSMNDSIEGVIVNGYDTLVEDKIFYQQLKNYILECDHLSEKEKDILFKISSASLSYFALAKQYGITKNRLFQIEASAIRKLRKDCEFVKSFKGGWK